MQVLNIRALLKDKKFVFLIGDEVKQYPIDFKTRFGVDYSRYPVKPVGVREINRLIWHTQLASHNGGDFFNEIFDGHPNLICMPSIMYSNIEEQLTKVRDQLKLVDEGRAADTSELPADMARIVRELVSLRDRTDKDVLVATCMYDEKYTKALNPAARIAPALFLQPHFGNLKYNTHLDQKGHAIMCSKQYEEIQNSPIFRNFRYIKTFVPMRRITTGYGAAMRFMYNNVLEYQRGRQMNLPP